MAKQKIVLKVTMEDAKKRSKAMKVAVGLTGVISTQMDNECITVVGAGIDSVALTVMLRKKMGHAELISVGSAEEKKEEKKEEGGNKSSSSSVQQMIWPNQVLIALQPIMNPYNDPCYIM